jgi:hypothetical protein
MRDTDLISILRMIDINDDGVIDEDEFNYFLSIFKVVEPSEKLNVVLNKRYGTKAQRMEQIASRSKISIPGLVHT